MTSETFAAQTSSPALHVVIDAPTAELPVDRFGFLVRGWVWYGERQATISVIEAWSGDVLLGRTNVLAPRRDVSRALGLDGDAKVGYEIAAKHSQAQRGLVFPLSVRVHLEDGTWMRPAAQVQVRTWGASAASDESRPSLVAHDVMAPLVWENLQSSAEPPPDHLQIRQIGRVAGLDFFRKGRMIFGQLAQAFRSAGVNLEDAARVLDFGCGCGRVLQAFRTLPGRGEIWGCDIDFEAIAWDRVHLADVARFVAHGGLPPTPMESGSFDAIYAVSVFTHLPEELQYAWLTELRRLLRPGGVLVATVHGGRYWESDDVLHAEVVHHGFAYRTGPQTQGLPEFYMVAYHSESYVRARWGRLFEVVEVVERLVHSAHDAVILRRVSE